MTETILITGTRKYPRLDLVRRLIEDMLPRSSTIITGNNQGVESTVMLYCGITFPRIHDLTVHPSQWHRHHRSAMQIANTKMAKLATVIILFTHNDTLEDFKTLAYHLNRPVYRYDEAGRLTAPEPSLFQFAPFYLPDMSGPEYDVSMEDAQLNRYH